MYFIDDLFTVDTQDSILSNLQFRIVQVVAAFGVLIAAILSLYQISNPGSDSFLGLTIGYTLFSILILALVTYMRYLILSSILLTASFLILTFVISDQFLLFAVLSIILSAVLLPFPVYVGAHVLLLLRYVLLLREVSPVAPGGGPSSELVNTVIAWALILICSLVSRHLVQGVERATYLARRNSVLLQATTEVGQAATNIRDLNQLFARVVELIQDRFGFYHVQVFLVRGDQAELVASTGKVGERLLANRHRLMVGSNSVIGRVTRDGQLVIARDTDAAAVHHRNPLLPDTRAELAVPIFDGERVVGALDMQSTQRDSFHPEDVDALESMATLLSAAIRNVRLFEAQERSAREQQRLYREAETNLREIQRLNRQLTRAGWDSYVEQANSATGVTLRDNEIVSATGWNEHLAEAARTRDTVVHQANGQPGVVAVPVIVRGEVIGAIEVEPGDSSDQDASIEMVRAVAERLATSLENARLFEEAQAATAQEQLINQVVTRFQSTASVDDLLRITLSELSTALGAQRGAIRLGLISDENGDTGS